MSRQNIDVRDLQVGETASLTEFGVRWFTRVPNRYGYRDGACVVSSKLSDRIEQWTPPLRVWVERAA